MVVSPLGFEPRTDGLKVHCSTAELRAPAWIVHAMALGDLRAHPPHDHGHPPDYTAPVAVWMGMNRHALAPRDVSPHGQGRSA